ncbi:MAG: hypothetical protein KTR20_07485 [Cellvibrionaceae bacterium]|nr:hypothetical protein [Cellvibrionaceae bacterium]
MLPQARLHTPAIVSAAADKRVSVRITMAVPARWAALALRAIVLLAIAPRSNLMRL